MSENEAGDLASASKKIKLDLAVEKLGLNDLPDLALLEIAKSLEMQDFIHFSHTSSRIWRLVATNSAFWSKLIQSLNFPDSLRLNSLASRFPNLFPVGCLEKRKFMFYTKTLSNWNVGDIAHVWTHEANIFTVKNDIMAFGRSLGGTAWGVTVSGPAIALNWTFHTPPSSTHYLGKIFIFPDTVCLVVRPNGTGEK